DNKIKLLSVNNAKGLESKVVFIFNTEALSYINKNEEKDEDEIQIRNTKKLYTAMTRAQELLFISEDEKYIDKIDEKYLTKIEDYHNLDIDSYLAADLDANDFLINTNKTDRFNKIREAYKVQAEEEEKAKEKTEIKLQESIISLLTNSNQDLKNKIENNFEDLDIKYKKMILEAELLYFAFKSNFLNGSLVYIAYAKIIEHMLREFLETQDQTEKKLTLGGILCQMRGIKGMKKILQNIYYIDLVYNRNDATHNELKDNKQVEVIRKYLIEEEGVLKIRDAIHEEVSLSQEEVEKEGNLVNNYTIVIFNQRDYCSYLLDNDELVIYQKKLSEGNYKLKGHYINKSGKKYYRIDCCEKLN
ncbi:3'-5' exonuclease, partial [uncultured Fusobacterium sp.]